MSKSTFFSGQPIFSQILKLIPAHLVSSLAQKHQADRYYKTFKARDHLITMLYSSFHQCTSLRETSTGLAGSGRRLEHLGVYHLPRKSTLADANSKRPVEFFKDIYFELFKLYFNNSPDSRPLKKRIEDRLFIMDSTTVTLFTDVFRGAGSYNNSGRKKGGIKAHVLLNAKHNIPEVIKLTEAAANDRVFMSSISLNKGDILVFDKGYQKFAQWQKWTTAGINWVTRKNENQYYEVLDKKEITEEQKQKGIRADQKILLGRGTSPNTKPITVRMVSCYIPRLDKVLHFLTNNFRFSAKTVASLYQDRWQIETYFKMLKQNTPLRYFLGENENAIQIQLWCAFIKDILVKIVKQRVKKRWSFSQISSMIRHHIMNYLDLFRFLNHPEKLIAEVEYQIVHDPQLKLFIT